MNMLLAGALAGVLSNSALAQAPDLSGNACRGVNAAGDRISMPCSPLPPTTYSYPEKGVTLFRPCEAVPCPSHTQLMAHGAEVFLGQNPSYYYVCTDSVCNAYATTAVVGGDKAGDQGGVPEVTILRGSR